MTQKNIVVSKPEILSEVENFYGQLYASHASQPDPENEDSRATLTRYFTKDRPEFSQHEIEAAFRQLKNGKGPGEDGWDNDRASESGRKSCIKTASGAFQLGPVLWENSKSVEKKRGRSFL